MDEIVKEKTFNETEIRFLMIVSSLFLKKIAQIWAVQPLPGQNLFCLRPARLGRYSKSVAKIYHPS